MLTRPKSSFPTAPTIAAAPPIRRIGDEDRRRAAGVRPDERLGFKEPEGQHNDLHQNLADANRGSRDVRSQH